MAFPRKSKAWFANHIRNLECTLAVLMKFRRKHAEYRLDLSTLNSIVECRKKYFEFDALDGRLTQDAMNVLLGTNFYPRYFDG